ncbi:redoxin domain-containing protein [Lactococcus termiticola]|uniref:Thiol peroxidase n=1 Tax=Lactococcus termiticola TaxID=2169526 RepID=A0A2R5HE36_9LACT|nr:redoxin domain-containing protein [Lactococcus termiticola]GBG96096.1 thiol peroxidase [Lactococcus termiticola]
MTVDIYSDGKMIAALNPKVDGPAPDFRLPDQHDHRVSLADFKRPILISVVPDITHEVCSLQTKRFNQEAAKHPGISFLTVSKNSSEEHRAWCAAAGDGHHMISDDGTFGDIYGLLLDDGETLARAVYLIKDGQIVYSQIVENIGNEPSYDEVMMAVDELN